MSNPADRLDRYAGYLEQDPGNVSLAVEAFELALDLRLYSRAAAYLDQALAVAGQEPSLQYRRAALFAAQGLWNDALSLQADLCERFPEDIDLQWAHANLLHYAGRYDEAEGVWSTLQQRGVLPDQAWPNRLRTLHFLGRLDESLSLGDVHAQTLRQLPEAAGVLSLIAVDAGKFDAAGQWATIALATLPESVEARTTAGVLAVASKNPEQAIAILASVVQAKPKEGRAWSSLGIAHLLLQDGAAAGSAFEYATALMPDHIGSWHGLGWASLLSGARQQAKAAFERALSLDHNFGESHGAVAVACAVSNLREEASRHVELALRLDPAGLSARFAQAILSGVVHRPEDFQALVSRALRGVEAPDGKSLVDWLRR